MPELPEVEVTCQGLLPHLMERRIIAVCCSGKNLRFPVGCKAMRTELCDDRITGLTRRAKYLLLRMESGAGLIIHLGMSGNLGIFAAGTAQKKHDHVCWLLDNNTELRFNDPRRFGAVLLFTAEEAKTGVKQFFAATGPEPFSRSCSVVYLMQRAGGRKQAVKQYLMDSHVVAGIGNIYANEILFRSRIHPARAASSLTEREWKQLFRSMRKTLTHAISCGGSTISDFAGASGEGGYFQMNFLIYGKAGQACSQCGEYVEKTKLGGRATFFCPGCQLEYSR
ncbi:MAG: bifunctional DNA-formamidopyrimidine glycosylase/DNA-(apurinic or apyrimidinic site) lyase [Desulfocapsa sp.]|nr:bifunctional DNA-formamidopyrimidine glycosylase/DNA-(apurinic or apyrimidinic site) lyase [Desulfocapsa sp.]